MLEPIELVRQMVAAGRRLVALTDHDTLAGVHELRREGILASGTADGAWRDRAAIDQVVVDPSGLDRSDEITVIAGVEINSVTDDPTIWEGELHILGFGMDEADPAFEAALERQRAGRSVRVAEMLERLRRLGLPVDDAFASVVAGADPDSVGRPHVARALVQTGLATSVEDAFNRILAKGQPGYVPRRGLGPREAIDAIRAAGGLPVLAHFRQAVERRWLIERLARWGLGGLEVHYAGHGQPFEPALVADIAAFAAQRGLVPTGGSDYHGDEMAYPEATAGLSVPDDLAPAFLEALARARLGR